MSNAPTLKTARKHFERRSKAALAGDHLPSEEDLLLGMPFLSASLETDMREFSIRFERRLHKLSQSEPVIRTINAAQQLGTYPSLETVRDLRACIQGPCPLPPTEIERTGIRLHLYLAAFGETNSTYALAGELGLLAALCKYETDLMIPLAFRALNIACLGAVMAGGETFAGAQRLTIVTDQNKRLMHDFHLEANLRVALAKPETDDTVDAEPDPPSGLATFFSSALPAALAGEHPPDRVVVVGQLGNPTTPEGRRVAEALRDIILKPLPLARSPDRGDAWRRVRTEFPYATDLIDEFFGRLGDSTTIAPTILVGPQGTGKSRFARRLSLHLGLPFDNIQFGGMSDSSIMGTSRRWSSGEPSIAVASIQRHKVANPALLLDEVEKASDGGHNGSAHHALLAMLERDTAAAYHDPWVQAPVNISHVSWLMTANSLAPIPPPLLDRCRIMTFPSPDRSHLTVLSRTLLDELAKERNDLPQLPLDGVESRALAAGWTDGSLRTLKKMVAHILDDRDRAARRIPV